MMIDGLRIGPSDAKKRAGRLPSGATPDRPALDLAAERDGLQTGDVRINPRVLVVDDDLFIRELLTQLLVDAAMSVETFASARELLDTADLRTPAVLLLDMVMPELTGLDLQRLLRARQVVLPVIFLTGASSVPLAVAAMRNGAVDFIEKPFDRDALIARIRLAYSGHLGLGLSDEREPSSAHQARLASLTPRERAVLKLLVTGRTSKLIARSLGGSFRTIEIHRSRVMSKMGAITLADLVRMTLVAGAGRD